MTTSLVIEIRDRRLDGGRMRVSSRTNHAPTMRRREIALRRLIEDGEHSIIRQLRARKLRIEEVQRAVEGGDVEGLRDRVDEAVEAEAEAEQLDPIRLGPTLDRVLKKVRGTREDATVRAYETLDRMLRSWLTDDYDMTHLTMDAASDWLLAAKETNGNQPWGAGRQITMRTLAGAVWDSALVREAEAAELEERAPRLTRNPWKAVETRAVRQSRVAYLEPEQWQHLLETVRGQPIALALGLGVLAGLRRGEARNLRLGVDVDLDQRLIHVQPREGEFRWRPKTDRSIRTLDISDELLELIREHVDANYAGERYLIRPAVADRPLSGRRLQEWTQDAFGQADIKYGMEQDALTYHSTRHTFASWLVQAGVSPMVVAELIGDSVEMVIRVYGHLAPRNMREAMETVGRVSRDGSKAKRKRGQK